MVVPQEHLHTLVPIPVQGGEVMSNETQDFYPMETYKIGNSTVRLGAGRPVTQVEWDANRQAISLALHKSGWRMWQKYLALGGDPNITDQDLEHIPWSSGLLKIADRQA